MEVFGIYGDSAKVVECQQSFEEIKRTFNDSNLSHTAKAVEIAAHGTFITTQTAEFLLRKNVSAAPLINTVNGIADVVKIGIHAHIRQEDLKEAVIMIGKKILSHTSETFNSLANHPACANVSIIQKARAVCFGAVILYDVFDYMRRTRNYQVLIANVNNRIEINHV